MWWERCRRLCRDRREPSARLRSSLGSQERLRTGRHVGQQHAIAEVGVESSHRVHLPAVRPGPWPGVIRWRWARSFQEGVPRGAGSPTRRQGTTPPAPPSSAPKHHRAMSALERARPPTPPSRQPGPCALQSGLACGCEHAHWLTSSMKLSLISSLGVLQPRSATPGATNPTQNPLWFDWQPCTGWAGQLFPLTDGMHSHGKPSWPIASAIVSQCTEWRVSSQPRDPIPCKWRRDLLIEVQHGRRGAAHLWNSVHQNQNFAMDVESILFLYWTLLSLH